MNTVTTNLITRREACGYQTTAQRTCCQHCHYALEKCLNTGSGAKSRTLSCFKHDFSVAKGAICNDFAVPWANGSAR